MKKIIIFTIIALGVVMSVSSCGCYYPYYDSYGYGYGYNNGYNSPSGYVSGKITKNGTRHRGNTLFEWRDMSIVRRGLMVYVYQNGNLVEQFDIRRCEDVDAEYYPTGWQGQALYVNLVLRGVGGTNYLVVKGVVTEHYNFD